MNTHADVDRLDPLLRASSRRNAIAEVAIHALRSSGFLLGAGLVVLLIDACLGFQRAGLVALDLALLALLVGAGCQLVVLGYRSRYRARRAAVLVEERLGIDDNRLINAVDLASSAESDPKRGRRVHVSRVLARLAVRQGNALAGELSPSGVVDRARLRKAGWVGAGALALVAFSYALAPRVFHAVVPRLASPGADLPPYSLVDFEVAVDPERPVFGKGATIRARLSGWSLPDEATVVFVEPDADAAGGESVPEKLAMTRAFRVRSPGSPETRAEAEPDVGSPASFELRLKSVTDSRVFYIDTPSGRSRRYALDVRLLPVFEEVHVAYEYPRYTGWKAAGEVLGSAGIRALRDTKIKLSVSSNVPLRAGMLALRPADASSGGAPVEVPLLPEETEPRRAVAVFRLTFSGEYSLSLVSVDGTRSEEPLEGRLTAVEDGRPSISIEEPPQHVIVPEDWSVPVSISASDDIGVARVVLHRGVNGWGPSSVDLELSEAGGTHVRAEYLFDLPVLGARAGDVISYFATAYDTYPGRGDHPGANIAETDRYLIQVISKEEYLDYMRSQFRMEELRDEWEQLERRLEELRKKREELTRALEPLEERLRQGSELTPGERDRLDRLRRELEEYSEGAARLAEDMERRAEDEKLFDFEAPYRDRLRELASALRNQESNARALESKAEELTSSEDGGAAGRAGAGLAPLISKFLQEDAPFTESEEKELEKMKEDLEKLELASAMAAQAERIRTVVLLQRQLTERLARFRNRERLDPLEQRRANEMAEEQKTLRETLEEARRELERLADTATGQLPRMSGSAKSLCARVGGLEVDRDQSDVERFAKAGAGRSAHASSETAADKLETLLSDCQSMGTGMGDLDGCLSLPRELVSKGLSQLAQGMTPGMGPRGSSGTGFQGSMARTAVMGPADPSKGESQTRSHTSGRGDSGRGGRAGDSAEGASGTELLTPDAREAYRGRGGAISGVPAKYREATEAYLRRVAEESR